MSRLERELAAIREALEAERARSAMPTAEEYDEERELEKYLPVLNACWPYLERGEPIPDEALASLPESEWGWLRDCLPVVYEMDQEGFFDTEEEATR